MARKTFFINKEFQLQVVAYIVGIFLLSIFIYPLIIYKVYDFALIFVGTECAGVDYEAMNMSRSTVLSVIVVLQAMIMVLAAVLSIYFSHRIAGPIYKIVKTMKNFSERGSLSKVHFRRKDFFPEVSQFYNLMMDRLVEDYTQVEVELRNSLKEQDQEEMKKRIRHLITQIESKKISKNE